MLECESNVDLRTDALIKDILFVIGNPPRYFETTTKLIRMFVIFVQDLQISTNSLDRCLNQKRLLLRYGSFDNPLFKELENAEGLLRTEVEEAHSLVLSCVERLRFFDESLKIDSQGDDEDRGLFFGSIYDSFVEKKNPEVRELLIEFVDVYEKVSAKLWNAQIDKIQNIVGAFDKRELSHSADTSEKLTSALEHNFFEWGQSMLIRLCVENSDVEDFEGMKSEVVKATELLSVLKDAFENNEFDESSLDDFKSSIGSTITTLEFVEVISTLSDAFAQKVSKSNGSRRFRITYRC